MNFNLSVLGSTSQGNSTLFWDNKHSFLIDCGFSVKYIKQNLYDRYLDLAKLNGLILTHTHGDHYNDTVIKFLVNHKVKFYMHEDLHQALLKRSYAYKRARDRELVVITGDEPFNIGKFQISTFPVPHDSFGGCFGYNIVQKNDEKEFKVSYATDVAFTTELMVKKFRNSDVIIIESNHDIHMLQHSGRPQLLIDRIRRTGHISNEECGEFLVEVLDTSDKVPKKVILAHISQDCNTNYLAVETLKNTLKNKGFGNIVVEETFKDKPTDFYQRKLEEQIELPLAE